MNDPIFDFVFRHFGKIWLAVVALIVAGWIGMVVLGMSFFGEVKEHGLKSVVDRVWEGPKQ